MRWQLSDRCDPAARKLADRHYNRQSVGAANFVPPGRCLVFRTPEADAFWVTSWPFAEYVRHAWAGAWVNSSFRNESPHLASELITEAVAATLAVWPTPPDLGLVTFIDETKIRHKRDPGRCYRKAGFKVAGRTQSGLLALILEPRDMPTPFPALRTQMVLV